MKFTAKLEEMLDAVELGEEEWENVVRQVDGIIKKRKADEIRLKR